MIERDNPVEGDIYFVPKKDFQVKKNDALARVVAATAFIVGSCGVVYSVAKAIDDNNRTPVSNPVPDSSLRPTVEAMQTEAYENFVGDVVHENAVRLLFEVESVDYEGAREERKEWAQTPEATQVPNNP